MIGNYRQFGYGETLNEGLTFAYILKEQQPNPWIPTIFSLSSWEFPRSSKALQTLNNELGKLCFPSIYILLDTKANKVYISESKNIVKHLTLHTNVPKYEIKNWDRAIIINDGHNSRFSNLNDKNIRLYLINYLVDLFRINKYKVVTDSTRTPNLGSIQLTHAKSFRQEILILLSRKNKITKSLSESPDAEVYSDDAKKLLERTKHIVKNWGKYEAVVDGCKSIIRPGSKKEKGWQVTFRGSTSLSSLENGDGFLIMPRGKVLLIPLNDIKRFCIHQIKAEHSRLQKPDAIGKFIGRQTRDV
ncbi:MAG: hypothetical protein MUO77_10390 [Anaerolineales bacterium]|nr:hypothetical protein [Anaerolineales bacterium]